MGKCTSPTEEERKILCRNGIAPENVTVTFRSEGMICLMNYDTRDEITVYQSAEKKWDTYQ